MKDPKSAEQLLEELDEFMAQEFEQMETTIKEAQVSPKEDVSLSKESQDDILEDMFPYG